MKKKIVKRFYKNVSYYDPVSMGGGSGLGTKIKRLYYLCSCGKKVIATGWKKHTHS